MKTHGDVEAAATPRAAAVATWHVNEVAKGQRSASGGRRPRSEASLRTVMVFQRCTCSRLNDLTVTMAASSYSAIAASTSCPVAVSPPGRTIPSTPDRDLKREKVRRIAGVDGGHSETGGLSRCDEPGCWPTTVLPVAGKNASCPRDGAFSVHRVTNPSTEEIHPIEKSARMPI